jgi:hypothetical protein
LKHPSSHILAKNRDKNNPQISSESKSKIGKIGKIGVSLETARK